MNYKNLIVAEKIIFFIIIIIISVKCTDHHIHVKEHQQHQRNKGMVIAIQYLVVNRLKKLKKIFHQKF